MNDQEYAVYQALKGANEFGATYASQFNAGSKGRLAFDRLPALILEINPGDSQPGTPASPATGLKQAQLDEMWEDLQRIADTAHTIALTEPGFDADYTLPRKTQRSTKDTARAFLKELVKPGIAAKFTAYELPATFVTDLQADLDEVSGTEDDQDEDQREASGTTAEVRRLIKEGRNLLKELNTAVRNKFRDDPQVLAEWHTASHIRRRRRGDAEEEPPTPPLQA